jgi:hypothetical protein
MNNEVNRSELDLAAAEAELTAALANFAAVWAARGSGPRWIEDHEQATERVRAVHAAKQALVAAARVA